MVWSGGRRFEAFKELNNTADRARRGDRRPAGGVPEHVVPAPAVPTGTTIQPAQLVHGLTWTNYGTTTNLSGLTAPKIGVYATPPSASTVNRSSSRSTTSSSRRRSAPDDEFEGSTL